MLAEDGRLSLVCEASVVIVSIDSSGALNKYLSII